MFKNIILHTSVTLFFMSIFGLIAYLLSLAVNLPFLTSYILACITWTTGMITVMTGHIISIRKLVDVVAADTAMQNIVVDLMKGSTDEV